MRFTPLYELFATLRVRLTLWNTAVVLLVVGLTLFGVHEGLRIALRHEADELLREDLVAVTLTLTQNDQESAFRQLGRMAQAHNERGMFVQIFDRDRHLRWASMGTPAIDLPPLRGDKPSQITRGKYRVMQGRIHTPTLPEGTICVGTIPEFDEAELVRLTHILWLAGIVVMVVAPLGGYLLAGRATRPLARIMDTTARLHPAQLNERLPLRGSGDELDRLSGTINGFLDRIAAYIAQNREFTANAAHELRSPLAAIQSSLEVALNIERSPEEYKEILAVVLEECGGLANLINQLLLLAESDAGRLPWDPEPVHLDRILSKALEMFQGFAEASGIVLECDQAHVAPALVHGNGNRLRQVINNLIDNAIKFTGSGGKVVVGLSEEGNDVVLSVRDTGPGITPEDLPHIFERFRRGDKSRTRTVRGSGLGLAICRSIIVNHGGQIAVESKLGSGTTFVVRLPRISRRDSEPRRSTPRLTPSADGAEKEDRQLA
jgi:heavy metal sensor kinase